MKTEIFQPQAHRPFISNMKIGDMVLAKSTEGDGETYLIGKLYNGFFSIVCLTNKAITFNESHNCEDVINSFDPLPYGTRAILTQTKNKDHDGQD